MIHQLHRKNDEAASAYLQHLRADRPHNFTVCDADGWIYKRETKIARFVEHKPRGGRVQRTTAEILALQSEMIRRSVGISVLHPQSGVFIVYADPPFESAFAEWVDPWGMTVPRWESGPTWAANVPFSRELTGEDLRIFETGEAFPDGPQWDKAG
jgi:hypothetical protein